jgi:hypothetical protein
MEPQRTLRQPIAIAIAFALAAGLWWLHAANRLPVGVESKGPEDWIPWVSLAGSAVSLGTGIVGLGLKIIELRQKRGAK